MFVFCFFVLITRGRIYSEFDFARCFRSTLIHDGVTDNNDRRRVHVRLHISRLCSKRSVLFVNGNLAFKAAPFSRYIIGGPLCHPKILVSRVSPAALLFVRKYETTVGWRLNAYRVAGKLNGAEFCGHERTYGSSHEPADRECRRGTDDFYPVFRTLRTI